MLLVVNKLPSALQSDNDITSILYGGLLYRPMKKKVKGEGWLTGLSRYMNDKEIVIKWNLTPLHIV